jgi:hypothetical protein
MKSLRSFADLKKIKNKSLPTDLNCPFCGTKNRIASFFVWKVPWCGKCGKPLPEPQLIRVLRLVYRYPRALFFLCIVSFLLWAGREPVIDTLSMSLSCPAPQEPAAGIYARYQNTPRPVQLTLDAPFGANYFVKLVDAQADAPIISYFVLGGQPLTTTAPTGRFILKAASGEHWCGESNLFGGDTNIVETGRAITFASDEIHTIRLQPRRNGNLPLRNIGRAKF